MQILQQASSNSTPNSQKSCNVDECAKTIKQNISDKRKLRKRWQHIRSLQDKKKIKQGSERNERAPNDPKQKAIQTYFESLKATEATEYSLRKATKRLKRSQTPIPQYGQKGYAKGKCTDRSLCKCL